MKQFPFLTIKQSLALLRISLAFIFLMHAIVRIVNGSIGQFGNFLDSKGFVFGTAMVWGITAFEIAGGVLLLLSYFVKWISAGFIVLLVVGIVLIHASLGWFVGEHGTGGSEYSFMLIVGFIVIAANEDKK